MRFILLVSPLLCACVYAPCRGPLEEVCAGDDCPTFEEKLAELVALGEVEAGQVSAYRCHGADVVRFGHGFGSQSWYFDRDEGSFIGREWSSDSPGECEHGPWSGYRTKWGQTADCREPECFYVDGAPTCAK